MECIFSMEFLLFLFEVFRLLRFAASFVAVLELLKCSLSRAPSWDPPVHSKPHQQSHVKSQTGVPSTAPKLRC